MYNVVRIKCGVSAAFLSCLLFSLRCGIVEDNKLALAPIRSGTESIECKRVSYLALS